jgi:hypothetical protein
VNQSSKSKVAVWDACTQTPGQTAAMGHSVTSRHVRCHGSFFQLRTIRVLRDGRARFDGGPPMRLPWPRLQQRPCWGALCERAWRHVSLLLGPSPVVASWAATPPKPPPPRPPRPPPSPAGAWVTELPAESWAAWVRLSWNGVQLGGYRGFN